MRGCGCRHSHWHGGDQLHQRHVIQHRLQHRYRDWSHRLPRPFGVHLLPLGPGTGGEVQHQCQSSFISHLLPVSFWGFRCHRDDASYNSWFCILQHLHQKVEYHITDGALQWKSHLYIPFLGIAQPQPQFPHSCVCERFIYSQDRSTYFLQQNRQTDGGNI